MHALRANGAQGCPLKFIEPRYFEAQRLAVQPRTSTFATQRQARQRPFTAPVGVEQQLSRQSKVQPQRLRLRSDPNTAVPTAAAAANTAATAAATGRTHAKIGGAAARKSDPAAFTAVDVQTLVAH